MSYHSFIGKTVSEDSAHAVRRLFSTRYKVRSVREGFTLFHDSVYYVYLHDNTSFKVYLERSTGLLGDGKLHVKYITA